MKPRRFFCLLGSVALLAAAMLACDDDSTGPGDSCNIQNIEGYVIVTEEGERIGGNDHTDWCSGDAVSGHYLFRALPIPADTLVHFHYSVPESSRVILRIFDEEGRFVDRLVDEHVAAGAHAATWKVRDGSGNRLPPGLYRACLTTDFFGCYGDVLIMEDASEFWSTVK